jgi:hypothetical protein
MGSMNIFKSFTLKWWQTGLFKWSLLAVGIVVGAAWPGFFNTWRVELLALFLVPSLYLSWVWWRQ